MNDENMESGNRKHIDKIFSRKLKHYREEPPSDAWVNIREELDLVRRRKRITMITAVAAGVATVTVLSLGYLLIRDSGEGDILTEKQLSVDSVMETAKQNIPLYAGEKGKEEEESDHVEIVSAKEVYQAEKEVMSDENQLLAETFQPVNLKDTCPEVSLQFDRISALSGSGTGTTGIEMNYISRLDYAVHYPEKNPVRSRWSNDSQAYKDYPEESGWDELSVYNLTSDEKDMVNKWAIGTQLSPIFSYRNLGIKESASQSGSYYDKIESGLVAYAGGMNVNYLPTKRLSIQSGIYYSKLGLSVDHDYYYENQAPAEIASALKYNSVINSSGNINFESSGPVSYVTNFNDSRDGTPVFGGVSNLNVRVFGGEIIQNFEYLEIPVICRYKLVDRKIGFNLLGGVGTNFLVGSNVYFREDGTKEKVGITTDIKIVSYSSIFGLGIDYTLSERLKINIEPIFRYYLNSINLSSSVGSHPYSMGIFTGLSFYF